MTPGVRKLALTVHVTLSVGWLGAVASFLALAITGLLGQDAQRVRGAYLAMDSITWWVIVPLSLTSLASGIVQSLGTPWGLFQHYWVILKLVLTVFATAVLLLHTQPVGYLASVAAVTNPSRADLGAIRLQLVADAGAALLVLLVTTVLAVYKPRGRTRHGWRVHRNLAPTSA